MAAQVTPSVSTKTGEVDDGSLIEVLNFYDNMRKKNLLCDVVLEVQGRLFPAHRLALAAGSHFFFLMFTTGMKEATSGQVELKEVEPDVVEQLIEYIYTKRISLNVRNIQSMLLAADRFLMDPVKRACEEFLEGQLNASNCLGISILADFSNSPELAAVAEEHVLRCFSRVIKSNEFLELDVARLTGLLRKDEVVVSAEEVVFSAAVAWLQHDLPNRRRFSADVLSCVRFHLMSHTFLSKIVHADLPFQNDAACLHMIIRESQLVTFLLMDAEETSWSFVLDGMQYHMLSWESRRDLAQMSRPRGVKRKPRIAVLRSSVPSLFHFFNPKDSSCTRSSSSFRSRQNAAVVYCDGVVYILGGSSLSGPMKSISCYSIQQDYRFLKSGLPTPCDSPAACVAHGNIYVSGGVTKEGGRILHHLHCFNTHTSSWQTQPNMLTARCGHGSVELNGLIYVCGGLGSNGLSRFITNSCEVYNPSTQQWRELCPMTQPRKDHGLVVVNNLIYAIGGKGQQGFLRSVEYYNVGSNQWCRAPPLPYPMMVRCAAVGNEIYVLAGKSQRAELQNVLEFHVDDNKWTSCCSMKSFPYKDTLICVVD